MHYRRRRKNKKQRNIIIGSVCSLLLIMTIGYATFSTNINITAKGNVVENSKVIKEYVNNENFYTSYYRQNIVSATFVDTNEIPDNATESWDMSEDGKGGVMAWVIPTKDDSTKYDLYIGANGGVIANENSNSLFINFINLTNVNFNYNFDTSNTTNMEFMFYNCISLTNVDLSSFDVSQVTSLAALFSMWDYQNDSQLTTINLEGWDTRQVTSLRDMFAYNPNLTTIIGIEDLNTENITNMHGVFFANRSLTSLDLSKWQTEKVTTMNGIVCDCQNLAELNLCSFNTKNATDMTRMFTNTYNLKIIKVGPNWTTENASTDKIFINSGVSEVTNGQC